MPYPAARFGGEGVDLAELSSLWPTRDDGWRCPGQATCHRVCSSGNGIPAESEELNMNAARPPAGPLDALRPELNELWRRVMVSNQEIDLLQVEAAKNKRKWYHEPSVLVAAFALAVSVSTFVVGQVNVVSDRQIQDRNRLSALIEQIPGALAQAREKPGFSGDLVFLIAGSAAALIDKLGPEASTALEKIEVAVALVEVADLPRAKQLAIAAEQQSTNVREKIAADRIIANINFQIGDAESGREIYQEIINLLQTPQDELDSSLLRDLRKFDIELLWASDEFSLAKNCWGAIEHLDNAKQALDRLPADRVLVQRTNLDNMAKVVTAGCSPGSR